MPQMSRLKVDALLPLVLWVSDLTHAQEYNIDLQKRENKKHKQV